MKKNRDRAIDIAFLLLLAWVLVYGMWTAVRISLAVPDYVPYSVLVGALVICYPIMLGYAKDKDEALAHLVRWPVKTIQKTVLRRVGAALLLILAFFAIRAFGANNLRVYVVSCPADSRLQWEAPLVGPVTRPCVGGERTVFWALDLGTVSLLNSRGERIADCNTDGNTGVSLTCVPTYLRGQARLHVAIIRSEDMEYVRRTEDGVRKALSLSLGANVVFETRTGPTGLSAASQQEVWDKTFEYLRSRNAQHPFNYVVTIGTAATRKMLEHRAELKDTPWLFAAVTDPVRLGVVTSLQQRNDSTEVAGAKYAQGAERMLQVVRQVFPDATIHFVYSSLPAHEQDDHFAKQLEVGAQQDIEEGTLKITRIDGRELEAGDLRDPKGVYLAWHSMDTLFENAQAFAATNGRVVVSSTSDYVRLPGKAMIAVAPSDYVSGYATGRLIVEHYSGKTGPLGRLNVREPPFEIWINCKTFENRRVALPVTVRAFGRFDCPDSDPFFEAGTPILE